MNLNLARFHEPKAIEDLSKKFGDDAVIIAKDFSEAELREFNSKKRKSGAGLFSCKVLAKKDNNALQKFRRLADFIAVSGGSVETNSWAANRKADLLLQPFGAGKNAFDLATANVLRENNVYTCILFSEFLNAKGFEQTQLMKNAMLAVKLLEKAKVPMLFVSGAREKGEMRAAKDLASFAVMLGLKKEAALRAVRKNSEAFLERVK